MSNSAPSSGALSRPLKIFILCLIWYSASSASNVINKIVLNDFPFAVTVSLAQYTVTLICLTPLVRIWKLPKISFSSHVRNSTLIVRSNFITFSDAEMVYSSSLFWKVLFSSYKPFFHFKR